MSQVAFGLGRPPPDLPDVAIPTTMETGITKARIMNATTVARFRLGVDGFHRAAISVDAGGAIMLCPAEAVHAVRIRRLAS
jgi:hypothetical protein